MTRPDDSTRTPSPSPQGERDGQLMALVGGWLVVGVPAAWGVAQVVQKSLTLFR